MPSAVESPASALDLAVMLLSRAFVGHALAFLMLPDTYLIGFLYQDTSE